MGSLKPHHNSFNTVELLVLQNAVIVLGLQSFIGGSRNNTAGIDKTFHCNMCSGTFSRYTSLWICSHLHSGDKPFKCSTCGLMMQRQLIWRNMGGLYSWKSINISPQVSDLTSVNSAIRQLWEILYFWTRGRCTQVKNCTCGYATGWMTWELELDSQQGHFLFSSASPILGLSKPVINGDSFHGGKAANAWSWPRTFT